MAIGEQGRVHHLGRAAIHTCWDASLAPHLTISPGDTVIFETLEPSWGKLARDIAGGAEVEGDPALIEMVASRAYPAPPKGAGTSLSGHALTGPIAIAGAEPDDTLVIEILDVVPGDWGWTHCGPDSGGLLRDELDENIVFLWNLGDGRHAQFMSGIRVPLAPFCGVMGVAPAEAGPHRTFPPRRVGGNLDIRQLTAGARLYLPIEVPGALFSVGDAHAAQGDGEVAGTAIETDATVTLRFSLIKDKVLTGPQFTVPALPIPKGPWFAATGNAPDLYDAARDALRGVLAYLHEHFGLTRSQACILASVCVDLRMSQVVNDGTFTVSAFLPLGIFDDQEKESGARCRYGLGISSIEPPQPIGQ